MGLGHQMALPGNASPSDVLIRASAACMGSADGAAHHVEVGCATWHFGLHPPHTCSQQSSLQGLHTEVGAALQSLCTQTQDQVM